MGTRCGAQCALWTMRPRYLLHTMLDRTEVRTHSFRVARASIIIAALFIIYYSIFTNAHPSLERALGCDTHLRERTIERTHTQDTPKWKCCETYFQSNYFSHYSNHHSCAVHTGSTRSKRWFELCARLRESFVIFFVCVCGVRVWLLSVWKYAIYFNFGSTKTPVLHHLHSSSTRCL